MRRPLSPEGHNVRVVFDFLAGETSENGVRYVWGFGQTEGGYPVDREGRVLENTSKHPYRVRLFEPYFRNEALGERDARLEAWILNGKREDALKELQDSWKEYNSREQEEKKGIPLDC